VSHIVSNLVGYDRLVLDLREVLDQLTPKEVEVQTLEGKWYNLRIQLYRTLDNVIEGAVITFLDISDLKRIDQSLRESEGLFRLLADSLPQMVWTCRPDGLYDYLCPRLSEFTGLSNPQHLGHRWVDQVHPEDRRRVRSAWDTAAHNGDPFQNALRLRHHSGDYHWFQVEVVPVRDGAGQAAKWLGLASAIPDPGPGLDGRGHRAKDEGLKVPDGKPG
jgi:two-component system CheB/CheR fusion protein